jgi:hypothetical protein
MAAGYSIPAMSRVAPAKVRSLADAAKLVFVFSLLLAFGMRRAMAESKDAPWVGEALFALIALSGGFLLVTSVIRWMRPREAPEDDEPKSAEESEKR